MKQIVTVGGGTGSYTVLSGLKNIPDISLTALVSMADDGGSSGVLRDELGVLPPGDVRQCLVALSQDDEMIRKLVNYRFEKGSLSGHSFGNIFLAALEKVTGSFSEGVKVASRILKVKGDVVPVTKEKAELVISLLNGTVFEGENNIQNADLQEAGIKSVSYKNKISLNESARDAILQADYIILGPGNYYCSILPNIIAEGFKDAVAKSPAKIILLVNLTNKPHHTANWKVSDYVKDIEKYLGRLVDFILVNKEAPSTEQIEKYGLEKGNGVAIEDDLQDSRIIRASLLSHGVFDKAKEDTLPSTKGFIRHDSEKLAECIKKIIDR